jgi:hypothetical protein
MSTLLLAAKTCIESSWEYAFPAGSLPAHWRPPIKVSMRLHGGCRFRQWSPRPLLIYSPRPDSRRRIAATVRSQTLRRIASRPKSREAPWIPSKNPASLLHAGHGLSPRRPHESLPDELPDALALRDLQPLKRYGSRGRFPLRSLHGPLPLGQAPTGPGPTPAPPVRAPATDTLPDRPFHLRSGSLAHPRHADAPEPLSLRLVKPPAPSADGTREGA